MNLWLERALTRPGACASNCSMRDDSRTPRFDRDAWLDAAIEVLAQKGQAKLNIEALAEKLGVTKGSFYHHFRNRDDFKLRLVEHWEEKFTNRQAAALRASSAPARERLRLLMRAVYRERLTRYDTAIRSWAAQDPAVKEVVQRVDATRYREVARLFREMGFEGKDLETRAQLWLLSHSALESVEIPNGAAASDEEIERRLEFFTAPSHST